jgi:CRISPR/Cas system CSM-associated protein Csm5 (group 7 of RAMP superfamily)
MNNKIKKEYFNLKIISPVSVTSGEEATPLDFFYNGKKSELHYIDFNKIILEQPNLVNDFNLNNTLKTLNNFLLLQANLDKYKLCSVYITNGKFMSDYREFINHNDNNKHLIIERLPYNSVTNKYIIPGSSIKGCIRTAVISQFAKKKNCKKYDFDRYGRYCEEKVTGPIKEDSFKNFMVSDINVSSDDVAIFKPEEFRKQPKKNGLSSLPKHYVEAVIPESFITPPEEINYELTITYNMLKEDANNNYITTSQIMNSFKNDLKDFYTNILNNEHDEYYRGKKLDYYADIKRYIDQDWIPIRIGKYSHEESKRLSIFPGPERARITRTLASTDVYGEWPFGWAMIKQVNK